ncbi:FtsK/SpoIIIE domain-containing protein [Kitasatospora sp. NPDC006697]|uniref:FtsK/SpoIIIE domain-containing protein n=1 Tax=Kitasatospora sp. NPDC006697 TaxID=3364020 RepID=UPI003681FE1C
MSLTRHLTRGRDFARTAGDHAADMFAPLTLIGRGLRRHAGWARARWQATPKEKRGPTALLAVAAVVGVVLLPHGPLLAVAAVLGSAAWTGRQPKSAPAPEPDPADVKLPALYAALTPYLAGPDEPCPLYRPDGGYQDAFADWAFDPDGRLAALEIGYPAWFTDTEPAARSRIEQVVQGKAGRAREYRFDWDLECNRLQVTALAPLPQDVPAQPWVTAPGEVLLGFTDQAATQRRIPVAHDGGPGHQPPVIWRTGPRSAEPHLLALGGTGSGTSTLLRTVALQALAHGDLLVIDGAGTGEHACLVNRPGVLTVETSLHGALAALEWAARETERRLAALNAARYAGEPAPADVTRPLWLLIDHPTELSELAQAEGRPDPQELLEVPLRHGRAARVTVVVAESLAAADRLSPALRGAVRARVVLGDHPAPELAAALGTALDLTPAAHIPPGRGYARIGTGPVARLQVPATVDPLDEEAPARLRDAVIALLPHRGTRIEAAAPPHPEQQPQVPPAAEEPAARVVLDKGTAARPTPLR